MAAGLRPAVPGAVGPPLRSWAAGRPDESSAAAGAGLWPAAAAAVVVVAVAAAAVAGRSSVSAAAESLPGTPQGTEQSLLVGLVDALPETAQERAARHEEESKNLPQNHIHKCRY